MLEPYDGKLSRTVLRREGGGNTADPADSHDAGRFFIMRPVIPAILVVALSAAGSAKAQVASNIFHHLAAVQTNAGKVLSFIHGWCQPAFLPLFTVLRGCW